MVTPDVSEIVEQIGPVPTVAVEASPPSTTCCGSIAMNTSAAVKRKQIGLGLAYIVAMVAACIFALHYATATPRLAFAWLAVGIVASQIVIDLAVFPNPVSKGRFSALFRAIAIALVLLLAYFG